MKMSRGSLYVLSKYDFVLKIISCHQVRFSKFDQFLNGHKLDFVTDAVNQNPTTFGHLPSPKSDFD